MALALSAAASENQNRAKNEKPGANPVFSDMFWN